MKSTVQFNKARLGILGLALLTLSGAASAKTLGDIATSFQAMLGSFADVILGVLFITGLVVGGLAAFKFKAHSDNPQQNKITTPMIYAMVAALLIGLPGFLMMAKSTVLGDDAEAGNVTGGAYESIQ